MSVKNSSIRRRLMLLVAAAVLPLAVMSAFALYELYTEQREESELAAAEIARAIATSVDGELRRNAAALEVLASSQALDGEDIAEIQRRAQRAVSVQPQWRGLTIVDLEGHQIMNTAAPYGTQLPRAAETESVKRAVEGGRWTVGPLVRGRFYDWSVPVRVPVVRDESVRFVLTAVVNPDAFVKLLTRHRIPAGWVIGVSDARGLRVARSRGQEQALGTPFSPTLVD